MANQRWPVDRFDRHTRCMVLRPFVMLNHDEIHFESQKDCNVALRFCTHTDIHKKPYGVRMYRLIVHEAHHIVVQVHQCCHCHCHCHCFYLYLGIVMAVSSLSPSHSLSLSLAHALGAFPFTCEKSLRRGASTANKQQRQQQKIWTSLERHLCSLLLFFVIPHADFIHRFFIFIRCCCLLLFLSLRCLLVRALCYSRNTSIIFHHNSCVCDFSGDMMLCGCSMCTASPVHFASFCLLHSSLLHLKAIICPFHQNILSFTLLCIRTPYPDIALCFFEKKKIFFIAFRIIYRLRNVTHTQSRGAIHIWFGAIIMPPSCTVIADLFRRTNQQASHLCSLMGSIAVKFPLSIPSCVCMFCLGMSLRVCDYAWMKWKR